MIRYTYETEMRTVEDQPGIKVRWFKCRPGAKPCPFPHKFGSRIWETDWRIRGDSGDFGEVLGTPIKWVSRSEGVAGQCLKGPTWPEKFRPGVGAADALTYPILKTDLEGWPVCCCNPCQFVDAFIPCQVLAARFPRKIIFRSTDDSDPPDCAKGTGTLIHLERSEDGTWRGSGFWGPSLLPVDVEFVRPDLGYSCGVIVYFTDSVSSFVAYLAGNVPPEKGWDPNPARFWWSTRSTNGMAPGYNPCGVSSISYGGPFELIADLTGS